MTHFFVRRGEKVFGPVTGEQIVGLAKSGKVRATDEIATDKNGPWQPTTALAPLGKRTSGHWDRQLPIRSALVRNSKRLKNRPRVSPWG